MRGAAAMQEEGRESTSDVEERLATPAAEKAIPLLEGTFLVDTSGWRIPLSRRISKSARLMRQRCARYVVLWGDEQRVVEPGKPT